MGAQHRRDDGDTLVDHLSQPVDENVIRTTKCGRRSTLKHSEAPERYLADLEQALAAIS